MTPPDLSRVRAGYETVIDELRGRMLDDQIVDVLERYRAGGLDRNEAMEVLDIDYLGVLYELVAVYQIPEPPSDPVEDARQAEMLRLLLDRKEVPAKLRQPAAWRIRH
ncbi:hypothetical protein [Rhizobium sp. NZLR4b]|uniref:hypothetical protein n=1 Tax=Rhizobium sp. NZLR4b TaxID=2731102 RepID=UPI001C82F729|nr:hypothetical protein [Rhizobium sp. NZLR4b]MBX5164759.1 hypothetical protein [Rhizobium sp. NZLR4b]